MAQEPKHQDEVRSGSRFRFGKNWSHFLATLNDRRIELAEISLKEYLQTDDLRGKSFLDIGSGSGLFSMVAHRLGARVFSFDYDPQSVACTRELRRRYFPGDPTWTIEEGSVLDRNFLSSLGKFDVVYSWGVLHHTGKMWEALENVKSLVPLDGTLFIAIYNDLGPETDRWADIKRRYNSLPGPLAWTYAQSIVVRSLINGHKWGAVSTARFGSWQEWLKHWREYDKISTRGMSCWHDAIDWIGGHPYERATVQEIVDFYSPDGFKLTKLGDLSDGTGCNQFVFRREAPAGVFVDNRIPGSPSIVRQFGNRVVGPFERDENGDWTGIVPNLPLAAGTGFYLMRGDELQGFVEHGRPGNRVKVAPATEMEAALDDVPFHVIAAQQWRLEPPFNHQRGKMWAAAAPPSTALSDTSEAPRQSTVFLFEDGRQLPRPHALHDDIDREGAGRFSHWGTAIYFSTFDNSDPNSNGRTYAALTPL